MPFANASCWTLDEASPVRAMMVAGLSRFALSYSLIFRVDSRPSITGIVMSWLDEVSRLLVAVQIHPSGTRHDGAEGLTTEHLPIRMHSYP